MNTFTKTPRVRSSSFVVTGLVSLLLGSLPGCYIDAKIGDDPEAGTTGDHATSGDGESSAGFSVDTSGAEPGTASATSGVEPGTASATVTSAGEDEGSAETSGGPGVDPETALALCGVEVVPPGPGDPVYIEGIMCAGGCTLEIESNVQIDLYLEYGECLCEAMACGPVSGGTTGELPGDTDGEPDGCGPFPPGFGEFTCSCEMCSIDVGAVDEEWIDTEADFETICACMCGGAGCGSPL